MKGEFGGALSLTDGQNVAPSFAVNTGNGILWIVIYNDATPIMRVQRIFRQFKHTAYRKVSTTSVSYQKWLNLSVPLR